MTAEQDQPSNSLQEQLASLYADRERLELELGTAESDPILAHIRSLEERLRSAEQELRESRDLVDGTPGNHEAEMRLAEVVSERESFFENVASNNYDEVEGTIGELKSQIEALEQAMQAAEASDLEESEGMAPEEPDLFGALEEEVPEAELDSDSTSDWDTPLPIEESLEFEMELEAEGPSADLFGLQEELPIEESSASAEAELFDEPQLAEPQLAQPQPIRSTDPTMDEAMEIVMNMAAAKSSEQGTEGSDELTEEAPTTFEDSSPDLADELAAQFGIDPVPSEPGPIQPSGFMSDGNSGDSVRDHATYSTGQSTPGEALSGAASEAGLAPSSAFAASTSSTPINEAPFQMNQDNTQFNEPAAPFGSDSNQGAASSAMATAMESTVQTAPLPASEDAPAAAAEVQSFVRSLASLFGKSDFVFEGQTQSGRFRFVGKNG